MKILAAFIKKELTQTLRDTRMRFVLFAAPLIQLIIFGYVATTDVKNIAFHAVDFDRTSASRTLVSAFTASGYFKEILADDDSRKNVNADPEIALRSNQADVVLVIPPDFSRKLSTNITAHIQALVDGSDGNAATIIKGYIEQIFYEWTQKQIMASLHSRATTPSINPRITVLFNPELKSSHFMVPGLICMILLLLTAILSAMAITREKELGTLEQILVSPLKRWEFIVGKTLPFVLVGFVDVLLILGVAKLLFDIPVRGNLLLLSFSSLIFLFTSLGIGLIAATVSRTQAQAMLTVMPIMMPAFLLSGLFFPVASIPEVLRWIPYINPITYFLIIVRGILLKGLGIGMLYREISVLIVFGIGFLTISSMFFQKKLG
ncbi:MAG TPA: ABC transporter permease [bacterium]